MGNAWMRECVFCRFQFPEVSARPEDGWKLIHHSSQRPYCEASLHTQISWNIWAWIQSYCPSRSSNGWFPDCIREQQVNLCSLSETSEPTKLRRTTCTRSRHSLYRGINEQMYTVMKSNIPSMKSWLIFMGVLSLKLCAFLSCPYDVAIPLVVHIVWFFVVDIQCEGAALRQRERANIKQIWRL